MGDKFQKAIAFVYIKNETLFVAVTHPGFKMELNYNRDLLKDVLTQFSRYNSDCAMLQANKVVVFHSKFHTPERENPSSAVPRYSELSTAEFPIETSDDELKNRFENIQKQIEKNR